MNIHSKRKKILEFLAENRVITTSEIAEFLSVSWNTAEKLLLEMALEQKILRLKKEGVNLWILPSKPKSIKTSDPRQKQIISLLSKVQVITTSELAESLSISWNTAEKMLLEMALSGRIMRIKKSGVNLWVMK